MTLGQETRWAYSTTLPSPNGAKECAATTQSLTEQQHTNIVVKLWCKMVIISDAELYQLFML